MGKKNMMSPSEKRDTRGAKEARTQSRKAKRIRVQAEAERRNAVLRAQGKLTPWEAAKAAAKARKAEAKAGSRES